MINNEIKLHQGLIYHLEDNLDEAKKIYLELLQESTDACLFYLLGSIEYNSNELEKAQDYYNKAINLNCNIVFKEDYSNCLEIIIILFMTITDKENIFKFEDWDKVLTLRPVMAATYINVSKSYLDINDISNALRICNEGLQLYPDNLDLLFNKGAALLKSKNMEKGWEFNEYRIQIFDHHKLRFSTEIKPKYDGTQNISGKTIYVYPNAGIGDTIIFSRYLPLLAELGAKVIAKPQKCLLSLLKESDLKVEFIEEEIPDESLDFDYQLQFMSLANAFKTSNSTVPYSKGFLKANKDKSQEYFRKYFNHNKFKVGIFWQSGSFDRRSLSLEHFFPIFNNKNTQFYSLQKGNSSEQLKNIPEDVEVIDLGSTFNDFSDTAAAVENLDLLIGCDTSITNLAGAMGKPVWVLLPYCSDWKWGLFSEHTSWYESARLFRQKEIGNWTEVIHRIKEKLLVL